MATIAQITPEQALQDGWTIIDVRSTSERNAGSVPGSLHIPLESVEVRVPELQGTRTGIGLLCQGGTRAKLAQQRLALCGIDTSVIEGGLARWKREGLPIERRTHTSWSLERQVRFSAGVLVLSGTLAAVFVSHYFLWVTGFVGGGLTFAGASGTCMMGELLALMPWNQAQSV